MSDLMQGTSGYAIGNIDSATTLVNGVSSRAAEHINGPAAAVVQIEQILGSALTLKGTVADLATRLSIALASSGLFALSNGTGYTTDRGFIASSATSIAIANHTPVGVVQVFAGDTAPAQWLFCNGQLVSRTVYSKLFAVIQTTYGVGDGLTTFGVPDLRGRVVVMLDGGIGRITSASTNGANAVNLGGVGGAQTHTLTTAQIPAHTHPIPTGTALAAGGLNAHASTATGDQATSSTGGGAAHSNTQPWMAMNYMIYVGV